MTRRKKYHFNRETKKQLGSFKEYLKSLGNSENTIKQKLNYTGCFLKWSENENLIPEDTRYNDLLNFIDYCKTKGDSKKLINRKLQSIRNFYEHLKQQDPNIKNPAINLHIKGIRHKIPANILDIKELEKLYNNYKTNTLRQKRNKVILGLLIYQGITTEELHQLEPQHLELEKGKVYIPGNPKRNSRKLELKPFQILELHEYLNEIRPAIINQLDEPKPSRKPNKIDKAKLQDQLIISINGSNNIKSSLLHLFKEIQKTNPEILHAKQIRASVITNWLKNYNLRQVQYFAGHKYVSSTERYQLDNLEKLQDKLEKYHPLKQT